MPSLKREWTADDFDSLPDDGNRYEIIDGELFATPAPGFAHQRALLQLLVRLAAYLEREPVAQVLHSPADIRMSQKDVVQPDVFVFPRGPRKWSDITHLMVAIEVLSPSTARTDRVRKRNLYQKKRVDQYWIVDLDSRVIERYLPDDARPEILSETLEWHPAGASAPFILDLDEYFSVVLD